jgi:hypothetical protein
MIPKWKIAREARRVREQLKAFVMPLVYWLRQRNFDRNRDSRITVDAGEYALGENVVILLVYQPQGLSPSTFHTLEHIHKTGFSAFVVLNSVISDADYSRLKAHSALIMKRPNFGYDFGGYRDAILYLAKQSLALNSITCINDSIWFPVFQECDHLTRMLNVAGNLIGYSFSKGLGTKKIAHVQSYFFMFKGNDFLKSHDFYSYWSSLKVSDSRHFTIRNSEMKMTGYFEKRNSIIGWLFSADDMMKFYKTCPDQQIIDAVRYLQAIGHHSASMFKNVSLQDVVTVRGILLSGLQAGKISRNVIGSEPGMLYRGLNFAAMKKSKSQNYVIQRQIAIDRQISQNFAPEVVQEVAGVNASVRKIS